MILEITIAYIKFKIEQKRKTKVGNFIIDSLKTK